MVADGGAPEERLHPTGDGDLRIGRGRRLHLSETRERVVDAPVVVGLRDTRQKIGDLLLAREIDRRRRCRLADRSRERCRALRRKARDRAEACVERRLHCAGRKRIVSDRDAADARRLRDPDRRERKQAGEKRGAERNQSSWFNRLGT